MSAGFQVTVTGVEETAKALAQAPRSLVARGFVRALDAAGRVMLHEVASRTPFDLKAAKNKAHGGKGPLRGGLNEFIELDSQFRGGSVAIGFGRTLGQIALWVEYGHRLVGRSAREGSLLETLQSVYGPMKFTAKVTDVLSRRGRKVISKGAQIGEVRPHPFMRPAFDASADRAVDAFAKALEDTVRGLI